MSRSIDFRTVLPALTAFLLILVPLSEVLAQGFVDYGNYTHWRRTVDIGGQPIDGVMLGDQMLLLDYFSQLRVVDATAPFDPRPITSVSFEGESKRLAVAGDLACVAAGNGGLLVFDISDLAQPVEMGRVPAFNARRVAMADGHAYASDQTSYLRVVDLADPSTPVIVASLFLGSTIRAIVAGSGHVYFLNVDDELHTVDISDPENPVLVHGVALDFDPISITLAGDRLLVPGADGDAGQMAIFSLATPAAPQLVGGVATERAAVAVAMLGQTALVSTDGFFEVIDVADPAVPQRRVRVTIQEYGYRAVFAGPTAAYLLYDDMPVIDLGNLGSAPLVVDYPEPTAAGIATDGSYIYLKTHGFQVLDVTRPGVPRAIGVWDDLLEAQWCEDLAVENGLVYTLIDGQEIRIVDVSDPEAPHQIGQVELTSYTRSIAVSGDLVACATYNDGLRIVDVSDPTDPVEIGWMDNVTDSNDVAIAGDLVAVAGGDPGVVLFDVSDPGSPVEIARVGTEAAYLAMRDGLLAYGSHGTHANLVLVDVTNPSLPAVLGSAELPSFAEYVSLADGTAYAGASMTTLKVVDIGDPTSPTFVGAFDVGAGSLGAVAIGGLVYTSVNWRGMMAVWAQGSPAVGVPESAPTSVARLALPWPNPGNPHTSIAFELPAPGQASLAIYGVDGRLVRVLADGHHGAGRHEFVWDGRDRNGSHAASGVYLARLLGKGFEESRLLTLVK